MIAIALPRLRMSNNHRWRIAFHKLALRSYLACAVLLAFSILCLLWDLGTPERALLLIMLPHPTLLTLGTWALLIELGTSLMLALMVSSNRKTQLPQRILEVVCVFCSLLVMLYTGLFLAQTTVPLWNTWLLPVLFFASSMATGIALFDVLACFVPGACNLQPLLRVMHVAHGLVLLFEAAVLTAYVLAVQANPAAASAFAQLMQPAMLSWGVFGVCAIGIAAPLAIDTAMIIKRQQANLPIGSILCLMGGFILRYCVVACATPWITMAGL